jgi:MobA/VirD2-like, nuclease domain
MRSVVKHSYLKAGNRGKERARAHVRYIAFRPGKDAGRQARSFYTDREDGLKAKRVQEAIGRQPVNGVLVHKLILSPGVDDADVKEYTREVMRELSRRKGLDLEWYAVRHDNTDHAHCHVVVMARDKNGHQVRIKKEDYQTIKAAGDEYLSRNRLLEKTKKDEGGKKKGREKREAKEARGSGLLLKLLAGHRRERAKGDERARKEFLDKAACGEVDEAKIFGAGPGDDVDWKQLNADERRQKKEEKLWKEYCRPIAVDYSDEVLQVEPVEYSRLSSLTALVALKKEYEDGGEGAARKSLSEWDYLRLSEWVEEKRRYNKRVYAKSKTVERIEVGGGKEARYVSTYSSLEELRALSAAHRRGEHVLTDYEYRALRGWIKEKALSESVTVEGRDGIEFTLTRGKGVKRMKDILAAYERGEQWARAGMSERDYKKVSSWLEQSKEKQGKEKQSKEKQSKDKFPDVR